ncbi:hypothetical protein AYK26_07725 [Euryarchaeota archaeon SM23-78]|nr:MAG: hypothetical protein AYK26_07725 [Euryarchaeota archaeon SM23-78]
MASVTKGYTFGATEQVTNTKLHTLVDSSTIDLTTAVAIGTTTPSSGAFVSMTATAGNFGLLTGYFNTATATASYFSSVSATACNFTDLITSTLRYNSAPLTATASAEQVPFTCDSYYSFNLNGTTYYVPCASATA